MNSSEKTILVVDDTESNIDMLLAMLKEYDVIPATNGAEALEIAKEESVDLVLLDIMMPEMDGYEACEALKSDPKTAEIPVIFITAKADEESIEKAYEIGGIDYVTKPFKPRELKARVKTQLKLQDLVRNLNFLASYDPLTEALNRRSFFEKARALFDSESGLWASMIDVDRFKNINDTYGHAAGDEVLKELASVIKSSVDDSFVFGRMGGEEFALISASEADFLSSMERIRGKIEDLSVESPRGVIKTTVSIGSAKKDSSMKKIDDLLKKADEALFEAKDEGRNRSIFRD